MCMCAPNGCAFVLKVVACVLIQWLLAAGGGSLCTCSLAELSREYKSRGELVWDKVQLITPRI